MILRAYVTNASQHVTQRHLTARVPSKKGFCCLRRTHALGAEVPKHYCSTGWSAGASVGYIRYDTIDLWWHLRHSDAIYTVLAHFDDSRTASDRHQLSDRHRLSRIAEHNHNPSSEMRTIVIPYSCSIVYAHGCLVKRVRRVKRAKRAQTAKKQKEIGNRWQNARRCFSFWYKSSRSFTQNMKSQTARRCFSLKINHRVVHPRQKSQTGTQKREVKVVRHNSVW